MEIINAKRGVKIVRSRSLSLQGDNFLTVRPGDRPGGSTLTVTARVGGGNLDMRLALGFSRQAPWRVARFRYWGSASPLIEEAERADIEAGRYITSTRAERVIHALYALLMREAESVEKARGLAPNTLRNQLAAEWKHGGKATFCLYPADATAETETL